MEPLFSPWRGAYVEDIHKRNEGGCIFCSAFQGDDESHLVVGRGKVSFAMLNLYPYNPGHILIVPNRHLSRVQELGEAERGELAEWVAKLEGVLRGSYKPDGINVGMNLGKAAGAGIEDHLHVHMVPRWNGDTNFMPVFFGTKVISEALKDSLRKIRQALL
jgi:ATP adenylyltransferase